MEDISSGTADILLTFRLNWTIYAVDIFEVDIYASDFFVVDNSFPVVHIIPSKTIPNVDWLILGTEINMLLF